jgi:coenzyme F420-reducing hydrogenase gamma subunit
VDNNTLYSNFWRHIAPAARTFIACIAAIGACAYYLGVPRLVQAYSVSIENKLHQDEQLNKIIFAVSEVDDRVKKLEVAVSNIDKRLTAVED